MMKRLRELSPVVGWIALLFAFWLAGSILDISAYLPHHVPVFIGLGFLGISVVIVGLKWTQVRRGAKEPGWIWFVALWALTFILYMIIFPIEQRRPDRNDSYDALFASSTQLMHHHFPYYVHSFLGAPITTMPGALFLALPFRMVGQLSFENLFWLGMFIWFATQFFHFRSTALAFVVVVLANAHTLVNLLAGADYPINWMYICISTVFFLNSAERGPKWKLGISAIFLGVSLSSRPTYLIVLSPLIVAYLVQRIGAMAALRRFALPLLAMTVVTAPFHLYDPAHFSPFHITDRLVFLPERLQHPIVVLLIALAFATACTGFLIRLTIPRIFLLAGIASTILLLTPGLLWALRPTSPNLILLGYSDAAACFLSLWAFRCMEDQFSAVSAGLVSAQPTEG
jgi:hypothetical protein